MICTYTELSRIPDYLYHYWIKYTIGSEIKEMIIIRFLACLGLALASSYAAKAEKYLSYFIALILGAIAMSVIMHT